MEFNQLEIFLAIEKYKSFSKAAEKLHLTQPTISNNIQNLEKELGTTLVDRLARNISLTPSGEILSQYAREIINLRDQSKFLINEHSSRIEGPISLISSSVPQQYILPYIIKDFKESHPNVSFIVSENNSKVIVDKILAGKIDYGIVGVDTKSRALEKIAIHEDDLVLATPNTDDYQESFSQILNIEDFLEENFIFRKEDSGTRVFVEQSLEKINIDPKDLKITSTLDSHAMIKKMIELGQGVSFLSRISIENEVKLGLIKAFDVKGMNSKRKFYFIYSKYRTLPPSVEAFKNFLLKWPGM